MRCAGIGGPVLIARRGEFSETTRLHLRIKKDFSVDFCLTGKERQKRPQCQFQTLSLEERAGSTDLSTFTRSQTEIIAVACDRPVRQLLGRRHDGA